MIMFTGDRLLLLSALWCALTLMLGCAIVTEFVPISDTKGHLPSNNDASLSTAREQQLVHPNVPEEQAILPTAGSNGDNTASAHEEEDLELAPFFWNEVTWIELQARIFAETNSSSLCNETLPVELTYFKKTDQSTVNWPGPKTTSGDSTLCKFDARSFTYHLPHTMQSIYACWTMWQAHHGHPVLVGPVPNTMDFLLTVIRDWDSCCRIEASRQL